MKQVTSRTGSAQRFVENWKKEELKLDTRWGGRLLWACRSRRICTLWVPHEIGARWIRQHSKIVSLLLMSKPLTQIKRFRTWTRSRYVFLNFKIPMFFICSIVMNIICLFSTWLNCGYVTLGKFTCFHHLCFIWMAPDKSWGITTLANADS